MFQIIDHFLRSSASAHFYTIYEALKLLQKHAIPLEGPKHRKFLDLAQQLLFRDFEGFAGEIFDFTVIRTINIFAYYGCLTKEAAYKIFNEEYLDTFERSLALVKPHLKNNIRWDLMTANRTITVLYPEFKVSAILLTPLHFINHYCTLFGSFRRTH